VEPQHVEQRDLHDRCAKQVRPLGEGSADQQAALRTALNAEMPGRSEAALHQIIAHRDEIIPGALLVFADCGLVPVRPEFAPTAQVGQHIGTALFHPQFARAAEIGGQARDLEAPIAGQQRGGGAVDHHAFGLDDEIGDFGAVGAGRLVLLHLHPDGVKIGWRSLEHRRRARTIGVIERGRFQKPADRVHDLVGLVRRCRDAERGVIGQGHLLTDPFAAFKIELQHLAHDIIEQRHEQRIAGDRAALFGLAFARCPDQRFLRAVGVGFPFLQINRDQAVSGEGLAVHRPILIGRIEQMAIDDPVGGCLFGNVEREPCAVLFDEIEAFVKADRAKRGAGVDRAGVVAQQACARPHVGRLTPEDFGRVGDVCAAFPHPAGEGIFAFRQRAVTETAAHQQRVCIDPADAALALGIEHEAAFDELFGRGVKFAHDGGILAAIRQRDHAFVERGRQAG